MISPNSTAVMFPDKKRVLFLNSLVAFEVFWRIISKSKLLLSFFLVLKEFLIFDKVILGIIYNFKPEQFKRWALH